MVFTTKSDIESITKSPKCTVKLLGKPPFAFLFDVISAFQEKTGFAKGFYDDLNLTEEKDGVAHLKDSGALEKRNKIAYVFLLLLLC